MGLAGIQSQPIVLRTAALVRDRYFIWWRLAVRFVEAASLVALGRDYHGLGLAAAAACALYDAGLALWLQRTGRTALWWRLALDSVDVTVWSQAIGGSSDIASLAASPLALEAGLRFGWRGLVVPATVGGVSTAVGLAAGQQPRLAPFLWPLVAVALAVLAHWYLRLRVGRRLEVAEHEIEAAASRAELAGQNSVAAGADSIVDLLSRTTPLLSAGGAPLPPSRLAAWKLALAEASAGQASYLGVVLARWQRLRNSMSPDLRSDVELRCPDAAGTLLLSPAQAEGLDRVLDGLSLSGVESVAAPSPAPAGREQLLFVGGRRVVLPADPKPAAPSLDLGPFALLLGAGTILSQSPPRTDEVPYQLTFPLAVAAGLLALWAYWRIDRRGPAAHASVLLAALALGAVDAALATLAMQNPYTDHLARFPFLLFLTWLGPMLVVYWRDLSRPVRWLALGGAAAAVLAGFALLPHAVPVSHLVVAAVWPACMFLVSLRLRDMLGQDESDVAVELALRQEAAIDAAYRRGQRLVADLVRAAADDAEKAYQELRGGLPPAVAAEFERRLTEVGTRLARLPDDEPQPAAQPA